MFKNEKINKFCDEYRDYFVQKQSQYEKEQFTENVSKVNKYVTKYDSKVKMDNNEQRKPIIDYLISA